MIRLLVALLLGVSAFAVSASETPAPEPSSTLGTGLYCVPIPQTTNDECGWEFDDGRYVDPRWINACAPECAGVNQRIQNQDKCEWKLLYDGSTATPMYWQPEATITPTITPTPDPNQVVCGSAKTGFVPLNGSSYDGSAWRGVYSLVRISQANYHQNIVHLEYEFDSPATLTNFYADWGNPATLSAQLSVVGFNGLTHLNHGFSANSTSGTWEGQISNVRFVRLYLAMRMHEPTISEQDARDWFAVSSINMCATQFQPDVMPTPTPTPTPSPTPTPETNCTNTGKGIHMDGVASDDCQRFYPSPWDEFINSNFADPVPSDCEGSYHFEGELPPLYDDEPDTVWFGGATYSAFCSPGLVYTLYLSEEQYYQRVCQTDGWETIQHLGSRPAIEVDNPLFSIGVSRIYEPSEIVWGTIDNFWISYYDKPLCLDSGIQCHQPMYVDEIPALFEWFTVEKTIVTCYTLIPEIDISVQLINLDITYDGLGACFELYKFGDIRFFGVIVDVMMFIRVAMIGFILRNVMTR